MVVKKSIKMEAILIDCQGSRINNAELGDHYHKGEGCILSETGWHDLQKDRFSKETYGS